MEIYYVTGNKGKVELINMIYKDMDVHVIQEDMETPEIQHFDCREVAKFSAEFAANYLGKPVLKNDSGLVIESLNGFPGAFAKYAEESLGSEGFLKLLEGERTASATGLKHLLIVSLNMIQLFLNLVVMVL